MMQSENRWYLPNAYARLGPYPSFMDTEEYKIWAKDLPPMANVYGFLKQKEEVKNSTMLEF